MNRHAFLRLMLGLPVLAGLANSGCLLIAQAIALAPIKLLFLCIPEGTRVDTPDGPRAIESIRPGDAVVGYDGSVVRVLQVQGYLEDPERSEFLRVEFDDGAVVALCAMHRIAGVRAERLRKGDAVGARTVVAVSRFAGVARSYDLLTEDAGYRISGVPVNSMIEEMYEAGRRERRPLHR